jgi:hypothetical protein
LHVKKWCTRTTNNKQGKCPTCITTTHKANRANRTLAKNGRRKWTHQPLEKAMEMVERGTTTMRITSISSLTNHLNG